MKKLLFILFCLLFSGSVLFSQDLSPIRRDLARLLEGLGGELIRDVQQNELEGAGLFIGEMGDKNFFFAMSLGALFTDGIFKFVDPENVEYFEMLNVSGLLNEFMPEGTAADIYEKTKTFFLYPNTRISIGFKIFDIETILMFSMLPQGLTDAVSGLAKIEGLELSNLNIGGRIRYPLLKDHDGFPAVSLGAGYTYGSFHAAYALPAFEQDFSGNTMSLSGQISLDTLVHTGGVDFTISKKFLFFAPYLKISSYYQLTTYRGIINNYKVELGPEPDIISPVSELSVSDLSVILGGGFELIFGSVSIVPGATYNLSSGSPAFNLAIRAQF